ncbi:DUF4365 domain-containing protein [Pseudanabaena sp. ABRG5-3]|uniref:DUF4365 domain-containing protein n=1 Tax=Pseudanabaena sp. ABRG5-3 TaxID=685565 RepID=UPI000DC71493|nr:DUF4365 and DUF1817 domain-containing protein [Pseudanabaena sp. ABRG5-3]BBC27082.1 hypothetical protein ABRG53_e008 [Pseudanabaena sp. ABRG5-3]
MDNFPIFSGSAQKGELGIVLVSRLFSEEFKWIFRRVHQEDDFGIDGFVDIVNDNNQVTGRSFAVQVKCGDSYFKESKYNEYWYLGNNKHLNYLLNHPVPVVIIIVNPNNKQMFWSVFNINETEDYSSGWRMPIPKSQMLTLDAKASLKQLVGEEKDYTDDIDCYRKMNIGLSKADLIDYPITREAVESHDFLWTTKFFDRLLVNSITARRCQGCASFYISGYDSDPRALYEIPEVRHYLQQLESMPWFYFLNPHPITRSLQILMFSICNIQIKGNYVYVDPDDKIAFLNRNFARLSIITNKLGLSLEENQKISNSIVEYFFQNT